MIMLACSMAPSVYAPTLVHREPVRLDNALMAALETTPSKCAEGLGTSTSSTLMHTKQQLMTQAVGTPCRTPTTKNGMKTWAIAAYRHQHRWTARGQTGPGKAVLREKPFRNPASTETAKSCIRKNHVETGQRAAQGQSCNLKNMEATTARGHPPTRGTATCKPATLVLSRKNVN